MNLKCNTVRRIMKETTSSPITSDSIFYMREITESFIKATTEAAEELLEKENKYRVVQGLRPKKRLSEKEIKEVIKCTFLPPSQKD